MVIIRFFYFFFINENVFYLFIEGVVYGLKFYDCGCDCEGYVG